MRKNSQQKNNNIIIIPRPLKRSQNQNNFANATKNGKIFYLFSPVLLLSSGQCVAFVSLVCWGQVWREERNKHETPPNKLLSAYAI